MSSIWKHRPLTSDEKSTFRFLFKFVEQRDPVFAWLKVSDVRLYLWPFIIYSILFLGFLQGGFMPTTQELLIAFLGFVATQPIFVAAHMLSHALFLEYDQISLDSKRMIFQPPIFFLAFAHHHWIDQDLSSANSEQGYRNIVAGHYHGFTLLRHPMVLWWLTVLSIVAPRAIWYFVGYETGAMLIVYAHGFQHYDRNKFHPVFHRFMSLLSVIGLVANKADHECHHIHTHTTVYQGFGTSALYCRWLEPFWNKLWDQAFLASSSEIGNRVYDHLFWKTRAITLFFIVVLPILTVILF